MTPKKLGHKCKQTSSTSNTSDLLKKHFLRKVLWMVLAFSESFRIESDWMLVDGRSLTEKIGGDDVGGGEPERHCGNC